MSNLSADIRDIALGQIQSALFFGTVTAVSSRTVKITPVGSLYEISQFIAIAKSYATPTIGDYVCVLHLGAGYLVLCAVG